MKENVLGTVRSLVRLAAEAENIEEARNAALQACKLIHKHRLLDEAGSGASLRPPSGGWRESVREAVDGEGPLEDLFDGLFGNERPARRGGARTRPAKQPPPQPAVEWPRPKRAPDPEARSIPVLDPAWCRRCGQRILRGRFGIWSRGELFHTMCWKHETE